MNFTRWSARLPGTQRRAAAQTDPTVDPDRRGDGSVPAARAEQLTDEVPPVPAIDGLPVRDVLDRVPALVALVHGPDHRLAYVNDAYVAAFGARDLGVRAREALPELDEPGLFPLLDQVQRSGRPRTLKSRKAPDGRSYTFTCTPVTESHNGDGRGVLVFATDVTDHAEAATRLRASERRQRETAVTLQRSLLPQELEEPDDLRVAATYHPGGTEAAVGGDWYDVITLGGGRTALVIGDVMGRGVRAAAVMGQLRTAVRAYARLDLPPHEVLQLLDGLATEIDANQIATCVYAIHDPNEGRLVYASAGHLPVLVRDEQGAVQRADEPTGPPLGTGGWIHASGSIPLAPGSTAVLYTDGLVERRNEDLDEGIAALERALSGATGSPQVICDRLVRSAGVTPDHDDDVAVLVLQHPARKGAEAELFRNAALDLLGGVEAAPRARAFASGVLTSWRFPADLHDLGVLATSELVANSLQHGTPPMRLRLRRTDRRLTIEVTDGDDHLPRRRRAEPGDESGRGIAIVATIASNWGSRRTPGGGKAVWCEFVLPKP
ncbi:MULTISPECIES: ATP-binding SpoIIE family protein phosphatase [Streptomyces]|uniref:ATP-binding SpoIIE family protein phosphatase n=1 Tax=Streptomyces TaxID=1883 RepID=UPI0003A50A5A|nr:MULTISPECIES: SpoIIE family protein phosphatase [Streptomyces]MBZ6110457.1 SpoIIE family protein phosphatase [Streptomyces olivaceus]MBZ6123524.1 SpoIIE family protein phosphatase [Streptomyces olivaceus]MBZ6148883.1 SpoIIE family protein phosphatase [Streptomyces olivaceus]MBZ6159134.1 SpoIIE family protein phosphatase [Streptomyces olivaceus]MBZ6188408.1 SpoIIE family protein phosphatase [Streptomyces olivaceus]